MSNERRAMSNPGGCSWLDAHSSKLHEQHQIHEPGADMTSLIIEKLLAKTKRTDLPEFVPGDTIRVHVKIKEGDKERLQAFEGVVLARTRGPQASFTVRKISFGQGVERIFPVSSRVIDRIELVRSSKVRRAKLYYLRSLRGKAARLKDVEREHPTAAAAAK
jgi:large subunit ribosomal protein L19